MKTKQMLLADDVRAIIKAATEHADSNGWKVVVAVVDEGGHQLGLLRLDGAAPISSEIATNKARTAAIGRRESRVYEEMINGGRVSFLSVPLQAMLEGGVPIVVDGEVIGAVGVSGVKSDQDAETARAGIAALGIAS
ncbi:MAG: heme-binding protein [Alcaligenaceae bacterium]|nr:heme-binding protein [Alcaligenaceae bacterium]